VILELDDEHRAEDWLGRIVDSSDTDLPPPGVIVTPLFSSYGRYEQKGLIEGIGRYFPLELDADSDSFRCPMPLTGGFWSTYAESITDFQKGILGFRNIMERLAQSGPLEYLRGDTFVSVADGLNELQSLLKLSLGAEIAQDGTFLPKWAFPSLLSVFAFAIWQQLVSGASMKHCRRPKCRKLFFTDRRNREYCSARCRQAEEKARQRRKNSL